jgi:hypothetical protein
VNNARKRASRGRRSPPGATLRHLSIVAELTTDEKAVCDASSIAVAEL